MIIRKQSATTEHVATKDDCRVFGKPAKIISRVCLNTKQPVKCNSDCKNCPYIWTGGDKNV